MEHDDYHWALYGMKKKLNAVKEVEFGRVGKSYSTPEDNYRSVKACCFLMAFFIKSGLERRAITT